MDSSIKQATDRQLNAKVRMLPLPQEDTELQIVRKGGEYIQEELPL